jgi:3-hydroxymyristoyl/3-hydroxydecanoyl-(acyl carrier protein) dehydratase
VSASRAIASPAAEPQWRPILHEAAYEASLGVLTGRLCVPGDLPVFAGHFPGVPIVPGVIQLGWVAELSRAHGLAAGQFVGIASAKFRRILQPGVELQVRLQPGRLGDEVQFEFKVDDFLVSCGRIRFGGRC